MKRVGISGTSIYSIFKKQVVLHTMPITIGITEILTVNNISWLMIDNPLAANAPLMEKPVACFALVSCMNNTCVKVLHPSVLK